jgi:hypothetical protein
VIVPKFLVPVDANLADIATAQERLKDGRAARRTPTFACESKQTGGSFNPGTPTANDGDCTKRGLNCMLS